MPLIQELQDCSPSCFIQHAERSELLAEVGLDVAGICAAVRRSLGREKSGPAEAHSQRVAR